MGRWPLNTSSRENSPLRKTGGQRNWDLQRPRQRDFDGLSFLEANLEVVPCPVHAVAAPLDWAAAEIIAHAQNARASRHEPEPGRGVVFSPRRDFMAAFGSEILERRL